MYSGGRSEELVGAYISERKLRDKLVLATKFSFSGGNGRKNIYRALEGSLRRLCTDYVDLYWMHVWDQVTPVEEVLQSLGDLVKSGKIRYFGLSDIPAWYATRAATLAQVHHVQGPIALQLPYSLAERTIEREHVPAALELGLGITPWSPLAFGFLTGKYARNESGKAVAPDGRLNVAPMFQQFTDRSWLTLDALREVSNESGRSMAQIALAWASAQPGITSLITGASSLDQLQQNLASLAFTLTAEQMTKLNQVSALEPGGLYAIFSDAIQRGLFGGVGVKGWR